MLTQKRLRELLHYDPQTGVFTRTKGRRRGKAAGTRHDERGFLKVSIDNERHLLHRLAWLWMTGLHAPVSVEHINGDRSDNRWKNLRLGVKPQKTAHEAPFPQRTAFEGVVLVGDARDRPVRVTVEECRGAVVHWAEIRVAASSGARRSHGAQPTRQRSSIRSGTTMAQIRLDSRLLPIRSAPRG